MNEEEIAEMEVARETTLDEYFHARPRYITEFSKALFRAGFERAWYQRLQKEKTNEPS